MAEQYKEDYQDFQLIETTTKRIIESVANFESDVGIIFINQENKDILERSIQNQDLEFTSLGDFPTRVFLGKQHPLAQLSEISEEDLVGYQQVRFRQDKSGITFDEDPLEIHKNQTIIYSNDRGTVMNLLCASNAYASGLGIVNSFSKNKLSSFL
jgi:DNA-binding transcriptional LysR family regulator